MACFLKEYYLGPRDTSSQTLEGGPSRPWPQAHSGVTAGRNPRTTIDIAPALAILQPS